MPWRIASRGEQIDTGSPLSVIVPPSSLSAPNLPELLSVRPAPVSPAKPQDFALAQVERSPDRKPHLLRKYRALEKRLQSSGLTAVPDMRRRAGAPITMRATISLTDCEAKASVEI